MPFQVDDLLSSQSEKSPNVLKKSVNSNIESIDIGFSGNAAA